MNTPIDEKELQKWTAYFQRRYEPAFHWSHNASIYLALPALRAYYPLGAAGTAGEALDLGGLGNHLALSGNPVFDHEQLAQFVDYDGVGDWHDITDVASANAFDVIGNEAWIPATKNGLTMGCWVRFDGLGVSENVFGKWGAVGQQSYRISKTATDFVRGQMTTDGSTAVNIASLMTVTAMHWYQVTYRFTSSTERALWVNGVSNANAAGNPATIFNSATNFRIGADGTGAAPLDGQVRDVFVCACALDDAQILSIYQNTRATVGVK